MATAPQTSLNASPSEPLGAPLILPSPPSPVSPPLLTIAIPTWNRAPLLKLLLAVLIPQIEHHQEVELLICDNGSSDDTAAVVAAVKTGNIRYHCHKENVGSDANFVTAFQLARGKYFWLCGDDDLPIPNVIDDLLTT